jgi:hypothetical protein
MCSCREADPFCCHESELLDLFGDQQFEPLTALTVSLSAAFLITRLGQVTGACLAGLRRPERRFPAAHCGHIARRAVATTSSPRARRTGLAAPVVVLKNVDRGAAAKS